MPKEIPGRLPRDIISVISKTVGTPPLAHMWANPVRQEMTNCVAWSLSGRSRTAQEATEQNPSESGPVRSDDIDDILDTIRSLVDGHDLIAYKSIDWWLGLHATASERIVVCPSTDQFDILRYEMGPAPWSDSEYLISELRKYDEQFGVDIRGAGYAVVEFRLIQIPTGKEASELSKRILSFAPDVAYASGEEIKEIEFSQSEGRIALWWD